MFLNLALLGLAIFAGVQLRGRWKAAKARAAAELNRKAPPAPAPPYIAHPIPPPAVPAAYIDIAQKMLFDRSRNSEIPVEAPPPPPPPPPVPPMPVFHGAMNLGDGPIAILSVNATAPQQEVHPGDMIGPFKLLAISRDDLTFEWNGQAIRKSLDEISDHGAAPAQNAASGRTESITPGPAPAVPKQALGPGEQTQFGYKQCRPDDSSPEGTVQDGFRKVAVKTPFGTSCIWEPVSGGK
jgi:hypothetical protein